MCVCVVAEKMRLKLKNCEITSIFTGSTYFAHSGKTFVKLKITNNMIGHKVGEFIPTRQKFVFKKKKKTKN